MNKQGTDVRYNGRQLRTIPRLSGRFVYDTNTLSVALLLPVQELYVLLVQAVSHSFLSRAWKEEACCYTTGMLWTVKDLDIIITHTQL